MGAISASFRDRIDFAFINSDEVGAEAFKNKYEIETETEKIVLLVDFEGNSHIYDGGMKVPELSAWLD